MEIGRRKLRKWHKNINNQNFLFLQEELVNSDGHDVGEAGVHGESFFENGDGDEKSQTLKANIDLEMEVQEVVSNKLDEVRR